MQAGTPETQAQPAFPELFSDHVGYVERVLRSLGVSAAELPDLRQEVFLVVHRRLRDFEGRSTLRTWLYGICLRVTSGHRRSQRRRREHPVATLPERSLPATQPDAVLLRQTAELLESALASLPASQRDAFVMHELQQQPMDQVAARLGCPLKTAYTRLYAARSRVNRALARALGTCAVLEFAALPQAHAMVASTTTAAGTGAPWAATLAVAAAALVLPNLAIPVEGAVLSPADAQRRTAPSAPSYALMPEAAADEERAPVTAAPRRRLPGARQPVADLPVTHYDVEAQELPTVQLVAHRISLSEVIPVYAVAGQVPTLPEIGPVEVRTRLVPRALDTEALLLAIDGRE